ncbi:MAG: D-hexose-6-phosphate mutarotase [Gemmatimonadales bacterium]
MSRSFVGEGAGGLPMVALRARDGAAADVYLHGAQITSWRPARGEERLFLSSRSEFRAGAAIRGGIPVIFPQFAAEGPLPRHGFARTSEWSLDEESQATDGEALATFSLRDSDATRAIWPAAFHAMLNVRVGADQLVVTLAVENTGRSAFTFTGALHSYLRVENAADVELVGLHGVKYRLSGTPGALVRDDRGAVRVDGEIDRVYADVPRTLTLYEPSRSLEIGFDGFRDAVLWNPGAAKAAALADMEPGGEREMFCVEGAAVQVPVRVAPGERWQGAQRFVAL